MIQKVNICGISHDVEYAEDKFDASECHFGQIDYKNAKITVNKDMNLAIQEQTICHEMVHGILVHLGYNDLTNDEQFVQALGSAIYQGFTIKEEK